jgi:hypothetical protein
VLYVLAESLRIIAVLISPVLPKAAHGIFDQLNWKMEFSGKENDAVDGEFASVIHSAGNVVLGYSFVSTQMEMADPEPERRKLQLLAPYASTPGLAEPLPANDFSPNPPLDQLAQGAGALGCLNSSPDLDGKIRHVPLYFAFKDRAYPSFCVRTVQIAASSPAEIAFHRASNAFDSSFAESQPSEWRWVSFD